MSILNHYFPKDDPAWDGIFMRNDPHLQAMFPTDDPDNFEFVQLTTQWKVYSTADVIQLVTCHDHPQPSHSRFHHLMVEISPPYLNNYSGWQKLLHKAAKRLEGACGNRHDVLLLCAIGPHFMVFYWDPNRTDAKQKLTLVHPKDRNTFYTLSPQLTTVPDLSPHVSISNQIHYEDAYKLSPNQPLPGNEALERFLVSTRFRVLSAAAAAQRRR